ncbi:hypothetical protein [Chryseobacterium sp.]
MIEKIVETSGSLDYAVNNAGLFNERPLTIEMRTALKQ